MAFPLRNNPVNKLKKNLMTKDPDPFNLSLDGVFFTLIFDGGAEGLNLSIPYLFVKTIEIVIRLRIVLIFFE